MANYGFKTNKCKEENYSKDNIDTFLGGEYDSTSKYSIGAVCKYSGKIYRAKVSIDNPEEWNSSHWDEVNIIELLNNIKQLSFKHILSGNGTMSSSDALPSGFTKENCIVVGYKVRTVGGSIYYSSLRSIETEAKVKLAFKFETSGSNDVLIITATNLDNESNSFDTNVLLVKFPFKIVN